MQHSETERECVCVPVCVRVYVCQSVHTCHCLCACCACVTVHVLDRKRSRGVPSRALEVVLTGYINSLISVTVCEPLLPPCRCHISLKNVTVYGFFFSAGPNW